MSTAHLFEGLKVIDLSTVLAGPSVASFFAEMGAEVIKVESPEGDVTRTWFAKDEDPLSLSAYYQSVNHNKKVITLDLKQGNDELLALIQGSDLIISNFKYGDAEKFDITDEKLKAINPGLIIAKIKGFERDHQRVAYDVVLQAETGFMAINGEKNAAPLKMPVALMDVLAAHQLKEGILCAMLQKAKTGKGCTVVCSLEMAGIASLMNQASLFLKNGIIPKAMGSLHPNICPYGEILHFKDGVQMVLAVGSQRQFKDLCSVMGMQEIANQSDFIDNASRVVNRVELLSLLQNQAAKMEGKKVLDLLHQHHVPVGEIKKMNEVMANAHRIGGINMDVQTQLPYVKSVAFTIED